MQAGNKDLPLGERLNSISIYQSNMDEFFMVRVGSLMGQQLLSKSIRDNKTNMTSAGKIEAIIKETVRPNRLKDAIYQDLLDEFGNNGIVITRYRDFIERLYLNLTQNENRAAEIILKYESERIHTFNPGLMILRSVVDVYGCKSIYVSRYGIREGYLLCEIIKR